MGKGCGVYGSGPGLQGEKRGTAREASSGAGATPGLAMPKEKPPVQRGKKSVATPAEEKVGPMKVVRHAPADRKRLPPDLEAFANSEIPPKVFSLYED